MPFKHQTDSYRNRNGQRFEAYTDECPTRRSAFETVRNLRANGHKAFFEKMADGTFWRVFVAANVRAALKLAKGE